MNRDFLTSPDPILNVRPDPRLAALLLRPYHETLNQAVQYHYQQVLTEGLDNQASRLFGALATARMTDHHLLARLIRALGGDPALSARVRTPRVDLSGDTSCRAPLVVRRMLNANIRSESRAITEYESLAAATDDPAARDIIRSLISDTQQHIRALRALLERED